jgi:DNA-binding response OmpR family regulator
MAELRRASADEKRMTPVQRVSGALASDGPNLAPSAAMHAKHRVLVVEDDPDIRAMLAECLRAHFTVHVAEDGTRALQLLSRRDFDALVVDLELPVLSGVTLIRMLRERGDSTPVLMVSGAPGARELADRVDAAFISKPFDVDRLEAKLDELLEDGEATFASSRPNRRSRAHAS